MEKEDTQGVCEAQDSEDKGMGSDFENSEDREGDLEERGMGSNPQDTDKRGQLEQEMGPDTQDEALRGDSEERELVSDICAGEKQAGISMAVAPLTFIFSSSIAITRGSLLCKRSL